MGIVVRPARREDTPQMAELLNEIIEIGGTTAFLDPVTPAMIQSWMAFETDHSLWHVAVDENGLIVGYQSAEVSKSPSPDALNMASFVRVGVVGRGIGSKLFAETKRRAKADGFKWLNATIRSDNVSGLSYYAKMGFEDWKHDPDATLSNGTRSGKTHKRFDL